MRSWEESRISAAAASASINKTLQDIEAILAGTKLSQSSAMREELRERIRGALTETALKWFRDGFRGGHAVAIRKMIEEGQIPKSISKTAHRQLPNAEEPIKFVVKSELPADLAELLNEINPNWREICQPK